MGSCDGSMKKRAVSFVVLLIVLSLGLTLVPHVSGTSGDVKVLSYSWYFDRLGYLVVVGEVQNVGSNTVGIVVVGGTVYTLDGQPQADTGGQVYVNNLVPQQKAPFYLEFNPGNSYTSDMSWLSIGLDHVDLRVIQAEATTSYQYPDLKIKTSSGVVNHKGEYWVNATIENSGTQTAKNIRVIATYYNSTDGVVAMGYTGDDPISSSLSPSGTLSFGVAAWDLNQSVVPSSLKIAKYLLLIQVEDPILTGTAPPPSNTTSTDSSSSSTEPSDSNPNTPNDSTPWSTYAIVAIAVIFGIVGAILLLRRRKARETKRRRSQVRVKPKAGKRYRS